MRDKMDVSNFQDVASKPEFSYQRSPVYDRSFLILKKNNLDEYQPVGDYTILDEQEDIDFAEKKVMNLVTLLNGKEELIDLSEETEKRLLFHCKPRDNDNNKTQVVFYALGEVGVSKENAILTLDEGDS